MLSFAIASGLFYGRFSMLQAYLKFSDKAIISPYKDGIALMLRLTPYKNNTLSEAEVKLTIAMQIEENGEKVNALVLNWTVVHPIN